MQDNGHKAPSEIQNGRGIAVSAEGLVIVINKSDHTLALLHEDTELAHYSADFGSGGTGDKEVEGDRKTPEGTFYITDKRIIDPPDLYLGSRWLGISYPNAGNAARGLEKGLIDKQTHDAILNAANNGGSPPKDTALGGDIGIHGGTSDEFGRDWTWGCIGLRNSDIEELYDYVGDGTKIIIRA